jgi:hypothetical protein
VGIVKQTRQLRRQAERRDRKARKRIEAAGQVGIVKQTRQQRRQAERRDRKARKRIEAAGLEVDGRNIRTPRTSKGPSYSAPAHVVLERLRRGRAPFLASDEVDP